METPLKWKQRDCRGLRGLPAPFCGLGKPGLCRTKIFAGSLSFQIDPSVPQRLGYMHTTTCNSNCICANAYYPWTPHYPPIQIPVHLIYPELISPPRIDGQAFLLNPAMGAFAPAVRFTLKQNHILLHQTPPKVINAKQAFGSELMTFENTMERFSLHSWSVIVVQSCVALSNHGVKFACNGRDHCRPMPMIIDHRHHQRLNTTAEWMVEKNKVQRKDLWRRLWCLRTCRAFCCDDHHHVFVQNSGNVGRFSNLGGLVNHDTSVPFAIPVNNICNNFIKCLVSD